MLERKKTAIYLVCFHSEKPESLEGSERQFRKVETAILNDEWPYDNGDDPSFYVSRQGGRLTWGVCRQDLRKAIEKDSIVVFFSFTSLPNNEILYRLCAVATVDDKVDHRKVHSDRRLRQFRKFYINGLITPEKGGWRYDETDRPLRSGMRTGYGEWPITRISTMMRLKRNSRKFIARKGFRTVLFSVENCRLPKTI